jgi:hypothetical protein
MASELGDIVGSNLRDNEDMKQSLSPKGGTPVVFRFSKSSLNFLQVNLVMTQTSWSASNSFLLGHSTNGVLGTATGMGGSQVILGDDGNSSETETMRRRYDWRTEEELNNGVADANISREGGKITLR